MATKKSIAKSKKAPAKKPVKKAVAKKPAAKKQVKKAPVKKAVAKKAVVKKAPVKKAIAKKAPVKKALAKKVISKKAPAKKVVVKKAPAKKVVAKPAPKKVIAKKVAPKKEVAKKIIAKPIAKAPVKEIKKAAPVQAIKPIVKEQAKPVAKPVQAAPVVVAKPVSSTAPVSKKIIPNSPKPIPVIPKMSNVQQSTTPERNKFSDAELKEFKELIVKKLAEAKTELTNLQAQIINANENGTDDTGASFKMLEDGSDTLAKEEAANLAARQKKFIEQLEAALVRIENKTYGICRVTGRLIPKERLRAVPQTTQSMEAKLQQYRD